MQCVVYSVLLFGKLILTLSGFVAWVAIRDGFWLCCLGGFCGSFWFCYFWETRRGSIALILLSGRPCVDLSSVVVRVAICGSV